MVNHSSPPDFQTFTRWLAQTSSTTVSGGMNTSTYDKLLAAARTARDETLRSMPTALPQFEDLQLLAAASQEDDGRPPELTTARGFRVTLAYEEGNAPEGASIAVLVQSPSDMIAMVQGETAYLWNGSERFALGQFDADGKAFGVLPAGVEISLTDFTQGNVKLEEPAPPSK
jgi:hypothetical protein